MKFILKKIFFLCSYSFIFCGNLHQNICEHFPHKIYNKNGNLVEELNCSDSKYFGKNVYKYDENNNLIEEYVFNSYGNLVEGEFGTYPCKKIYKYDSQGNLIEYLQYNYEGYLTDGDSLYYSPSRIVYKYDSNNNLVEEIRYNHKGKLFKDRY